jgi:Tannase and feruloyl esterase
MPALGKFAAASLLAGTAAFSAPSGAQDPGAACRALAGADIPAAAIGLPSSGAKIASAALVAAAAPLPEYCKLLGEIAPVNAGSPAIQFQLNLPTRWNRKALQFGGGGFNGVLITGLAPPPSAPPGAALPIARGYATFGTDSGHQNVPGVELQLFALNEEALVNFAYASYKKVRDVAVELMKRRYGAAPERTYFVGSSEGGRESLTMAQRFPADYDGIFSRVPVISWAGLQVAGTRNGAALFGGGWLNPAKVQLVHKAVLDACDMLDGVADGIISNYESCGKNFDAAKLRCAGGADAGDACLSDAQVNAVRQLHEPYPFSFRMANGVTAYPGWGYGGEGNPGGYAAWWTGKAAPALPASADNGRAWLYGNGAVRYFFVRDPAFDPRNFNPDAYAAQIRRISNLMDSTNPDLSAFAARGGKLIIKEHTGDYAQSPFAGIDYYKSVLGKMGREASERFLRLYVTPGADHGGQSVPDGVDILSVLEDWVEKGNAPGDALLQTQQEAAPPHAVTLSRPMCRYPMYPRYSGSGDPKLAASFACAAP